MEQVLMICSDMDLCGQKYNSPVMKAMSKQMMFGKTGRRK